MASIIPVVLKPNSAPGPTIIGAINEFGRRYPQERFCRVSVSSCTDLDGWTKAKLMVRGIEIEVSDLVPHGECWLESE